MGKKKEEEHEKGKGSFSSVMELDDIPQGKLPEHLHLQKTRVLCASDAPQHTESVQYSGAYAMIGVDNSLSLDGFCKNFKIEVKKLNEETMEFDMIGIDPAVANAFRRILISEVPTMAIEKVLVANNTSVIPDEVLAHRLGLIPINVDPRLFDYLSEHDVPNEKNTVVFKLHVECKKGNRDKEGHKSNPRMTVKSEQLEWLPNGSEFPVSLSDTSPKPKTYTSFSCDQRTLKGLPSKITPMHPDITIARLGPGQIIELEAHVVKGVGKTHAKWSPVATAWYRMLPEVVLLEEVVGDDAEKLVNKCPLKVFDIEESHKGVKKATVARPRDCTVCRECIREVGWENRVQLRRVKDHFIFTIESSSALPPEVLFTEAVKILEEKCEQVIFALS